MPSNQATNAMKNNPMKTHAVPGKDKDNRGFAKNLEFELALEFVRVVEDAAIASAHTTFIPKCL